MALNSSVTAQRRGQLLVITLHREDKRNALDVSITVGLDAALNELEDDATLACGILTGGTTVFSSGADLTAGVGAPTPRGGLVGLIQRPRAKPLIAAVEGYALGGGFELLLCCDLVVAAEDATFGFPEVKRGLMPDFGGAFRATRAMPANIARELLLTGASISAERAERIGFVNQVTAPGQALAGAVRLAEKICANAPLAVRSALAVSQAAIHGDESALWVLSDSHHAALSASQDVREGVAAFFARRPAQWRGQ